MPVPLTSHTLNRVPCWLYDPTGTMPWKLDDSVSPKRLSNIAATAMKLLGLVPPDDYDPALIKL